MQEPLANLVTAALRNTGWSQSALAKELGKDPSIISRWVTGERSASEQDINKLRMIVKLTSEKALLLGAGIIAQVTHWNFICPRSNNNTNIRTSADMTLQSLISAVKCISKFSPHLFETERFCWLFSIIALSVPFPDKSNAFIYTDSTECPKRFVILVNQNLNYEQQISEALAEISAHARTRLLDVESAKFLANGLLIK